MEKIAFVPAIPIVLATFRADLREQPKQFSRFAFGDVVAPEIQILGIGTQ